MFLKTKIKTKDQRLCNKDKKIHLIKQCLYPYFPPCSASSSDSIYAVKWMPWKYKRETFQLSFAGGWTEQNVQG